MSDQSPWYSPEVQQAIVSGVHRNIDGGIMSGPCQVPVGDGICGLPFGSGAVDHGNHKYHAAPVVSRPPVKGFYAADTEPSMHPSYTVQTALLEAEIAQYPEERERMMAERLAEMRAASERHHDEPGHVCFEIAADGLAREIVDAAVASANWGLLQSIREHEAHFAQLLIDGFTDCDQCLAAVKETEA